MNKTEILSALDEEISRLRQARDLLADTSLPGQGESGKASLSAAASGPVKRGPGRPKGSSAKTASKTASGPGRPAKGAAPKRRVMSAEGKARIAEAQRARWARQHEGVSASPAAGRKGARSQAGAKAAKGTAGASGTKRAGAKATAAKASLKKSSVKTSPAKKGVGTSASPNQEAQASE